MRVSAFESREKSVSGTMEGYVNMCRAMRRTRWRAGVSARNGNVAIGGAGSWEIVWEAHQSFSMGTEWRGRRDSHMITITVGVHAARKIKGLRGGIRGGGDGRARNVYLGRGKERCACCMR